MHHKDLAAVTIGKGENHVLFSSVVFDIHTKSQLSALTFVVIT